MNNLKIVFTAFVLLLVGCLTSCLHTKIYEGKAQIISRSFDDSLQDSAMIYGYVLDASDETPFWNKSTISIEETQDSTYCDSLGYFSLKSLSGTYTVKCNCPDVGILKLENLTILPNEKVEIKFLMRYEECF